MLKKHIALALALCLLLSAFPVAQMEEGADEAIIAAELTEAAMEATEWDLSALDDAEPAQDAPVETPADAEAETPAQTPEVAEIPAAEAPAPAAEVTEAPAAEAPAPAAEVIEAPAAEVTQAPEEGESPKLIAEGETAAQTAVPEIVLTKSAKHTMTMGEKLQINLNGLTAKKYKSSKKKVATVSDTGLITAVSGGKAKISVTISKKKTLTLTLTVVDPTMPTGVYLTLNDAKVTGTITANKGEPLTLVPVATAVGTASTGYKWSSSNRKIFTVSGGVITPKKEGKATLTVKTSRGGRTAKLKIKVVDPYKATKVTLDKTGLVYMTVKSTLQLTPTLYTATGVPSNSKVTWSSSNKKILTVSKTGLVTAKKKGTATVTVKTSTGKKAKVKIQVFAQAGAATAMNAEWVALADDNTLNPGDLYTYVVSMKPLNANADVSWTSDTPGVVRVENAYRGDDLKFLAEVRAVDLGYATLTATDSVTGYSQSVTLYVKPGSEPTSISFPGMSDNRVTMSVGAKQDVAYQVDPQDSLSHDSNRAYVTIEPAIATVTYDHNNADRNCRGTMDYNLHLTATQAGTAKVTVMLKNGVTNSFTLVVQ